MTRAWASFAAGGYGVAAAVVAVHGRRRIFGSNSVGRRACEDDTLFDTALAHAEINALLSAGRSATAEVLHTTLSPCAMCIGAAGIVRIGRVEYLGHDPACDSLLVAPGYGGVRTAVAASPVGREWALLAEILPLTRSVLQHPGRDSRSAAAYERRNPALLAVARDLASSDDVLAALGGTPQVALDGLNALAVKPTCGTRPSTG